MLQDLIVPVEFGNDGLSADGAVLTGRLSLDTLAGTMWVLRAWDAAEPADRIRP